jgi:hypothetical protein
MIPRHGQVIAQQALSGFARNLRCELYALVIRSASEFRERFRLKAVDTHPKIDTFNR